MMTLLSVAMVPAVATEDPAPCGNRFSQNYSGANWNGDEHGRDVSGCVTCVLLYGIALRNRVRHFFGPASIQRIQRVAGSFPQ